MSSLKTTAEQQVQNSPELFQFVLPFIIFFLFFPVKLKEGRTVAIYHFKSLPADRRALPAIMVIVNQPHKHKLSVRGEWNCFMCPGICRDMVSQAK